MEDNNCDQFSGSASPAHGKRGPNVNIDEEGVSKKAKKDDILELSSEEEEDTWSPSSKGSNIRYWSDQDEEVREPIRKQIVGSDADSDVEMPGIRHICYPGWDRLRMFCDWAGEHVPNTDPMLEIFSVSFHCQDKGTQTRYRVYGNIYFEDVIGNGYYQKSMQRPSRSSFIVSNGDILPVFNIVRPLNCDPYCTVSMCLKGNEEFDSSSINPRADPKVLIKEEVCLHSVYKLPHVDGDVTDKIEYDVPKEISVGDSGFCYTKIHCSITYFSCLVAVEIKLVPLDNHIATAAQSLRIDGSLSVHWLEFEDLCEEKYYKIMLFDTEWESSLSSSMPSSSSSQDSCIYVKPRKAIPLWRTKLAVPVGYTLIFGADFQTDAGDMFTDAIGIVVDGKSKEFTAKLDGDASSSHYMQVDLVNLVVM